MTGSEKIYSTRLGNIHYWIYRNNDRLPWLVMLPGLSADHRLFEQQISALCDEFNCFVWDAHGHGKSRPFELSFSMEDMADDLHSILEREKIEKPILIGQSLGGYISQVYMQRYPDTVSGFISIDSCSMKRKYYTRWEIALLKRTKWMYLSIPWKLLLWWGMIGTATTQYGRDLMGQMWSEYEKVAFCELADHGYRIFAQSVEANLPYEIPCPALLLCGEKDLAGSAKKYNREWNKQDGIPIVWLKGAGHNSNTDVPHEVNQLIRAFVRSL